MKNGIIKTQNKGKRARLKKTIPINKNQLYFLYTNNEKSQNQIKKTISFTISGTRIKYLGPNLIEKVQDLHTGSYKTLIKKQDLNK